MTNIHKCKKMTGVEAWIEIDEDESLLNINHVATEQDLEENHYLEEVGQTIEHVAICVLFCPYCGEKLGVSNSEVTPDFTHNDFSSW